MHTARARDGGTDKLHIQVLGVIRIQKRSPSTDKEREVDIDDHEECCRRKKWARKNKAAPHARDVLFGLLILLLPVVLFLYRNKCPSFFLSSTPRSLPKPASLDQALPPLSWAVRNHRRETQLRSFPPLPSRCCEELPRKKKTDERSPTTRGV